MLIDFEHLATRWTDLPMVCSWGRNNDDKTVSWYRDDGRVHKIWEYSGNSTHTFNNSASPEFEGRIDGVYQRNFLHNHSILLKYVSDADIGLYWCILTVDQDYASPKEELAMEGGMLNVQSVTIKNYCSLSDVSYLFSWRLFYSRFDSATNCRNYNKSS